MRHPFPWPQLQQHAWFGLLICGLALMYAPVFRTFLETVWATDDQGHGPIVLAVSVWLIWRKRVEFSLLPSVPNVPSAAVFLIVGLIVYVGGRNQMYDTFEAASLLFVLTGSLLALKGWPAVRLMAFPLLFLCFMVPLPSFIVQTVTTPLKISVIIIK